MTKWAPFCKRHFQMHFLERKCLNSDWNFSEVCSRGSNWQFSSIGSVNGLVTSRRQAIIWTNVYRRIYASLGLIGLTRLYWDWLSQFSLYAFIVFWIVLVYCMPQFRMGSNTDFFKFELNWKGQKNSVRTLWGTHHLASVGQGKNCNILKST